MKSSAEQLWPANGANLSLELGGSRAKTPEGDDSADDAPSHEPREPPQPAHAPNS